jgi:hypothetical protein
MNIAQLHERVKNLSDPQLVEMSQRGDTTASLALMELNTRNDMREASIQPMGEPPTIAEQEASKAMQGIGAPPIDPNMITPEMLGGIGNPDMMPQPQPMGSGVGQLSAPMMMAGGGLVELANGGGIIPYQNEGLVEGGVPEEFDTLKFLGDQTYIGEGGVLFDPTDPVDVATAVGAGAIPGLGATVAGGRALYKGATKLPKLYKKYKKARDEFDKKVALKFSKPPNTAIELDPLAGGSRFGKYNPLSRYAKPGTLRKDITYPLAGAVLARQAAGLAESDAPEGQRELMGPPEPSADLKAANKKAAELREKLKTTQENAAKGGSPEASPEKGGLGGFLAGISPEAWQGGLLAAAQLYSGAKPGEAVEKGLAATMEGKKASAARDAAKADAEYKKAALKLDEMQIKLVAQTARDKLGWSQEKLEKAKAKYLTEGEGRGIAGEVRKEIEAGRGWFSGELDDDAVNEAIRKEQNDRWNRYLLDLQGSAAGLQLLRQLDTEIYSRKE